MRQEQVTRRPRRHATPDSDSEDTQPTGRPNHANPVSEAASVALRAIQRALSEDTSCS